MILTKEQIRNKKWAVTWDNASEAEEIFYWKLWKFAFAKCRAMGEVGIGYKPTIIGESGFVHWISWEAWQYIPEDDESQERYRQMLFRNVPEGATINAMVFSTEHEADAFKNEIEKRMIWKHLGGTPYWHV